MHSAQSRILLIQDESMASPRLLSKETEAGHVRGSNLRGRVASLVVAAMLVVLLMVMLLLWNYKCIMIDHLCQGIDELETPIFTNDQTADGMKPII